jgi:hypothetical protein
VSERGVHLDALVERLLALSPFDYRLARTPEEHLEAFRLRGQAVLAQGWCSPEELPDGIECDDYDSRAIHVVGWDGDIPMSTGRIVLPPGLPTEEACQIVVEPAGNVADVGRMCVAPSHQSREHAAFVGLMCRLYQVVRAQGYDIACGMMTPPARSLVRHLGLHLEVLGPERPYWNQSRAPVRFTLTSAVPARLADS